MTSTNRLDGLSALVRVQNLMESYVDKRTKHRTKLALDREIAKKLSSKRTVSGRVTKVVHKFDDVPEVLRHALSDSMQSICRHGMYHPITGEPIFINVSFAQKTGWWATQHWDSSTGKHVRVAYCSESRMCAFLSVAVRIDPEIIKTGVVPWLDGVVKDQQLAIDWLHAADVTIFAQYKARGKNGGRPVTKYGRGVAETAAETAMLSSPALEN